MPVIGSDRTPPSRRSIRLRLTLLYSTLFLISGAALLGITYVLVAHGIQPQGRVVITGVAPGASNLVDPSTRLNNGKSQATQIRDAALRQLLIVSGLALAVMVIVSAALGWWMAGRALRPVRTMTAKAHRLSEHNLHERLAVTGPNDELKDLADTFDGLLGRLDAAFEAQKRFVANASHELRTPLTLQRAMIEVALADPEPDVESLRAVCQRVLVAGDDQARLIEALLTLARSQRGLDRRETVDIDAVAAMVVEERETNGVRLGTALGAARTTGDRRLVERLITNLVDNALRHNVSDGWVGVWTGSHNGQPMLRVVNTGPVVPPDRVGALFEPFHRLESRVGHRDGLGLGLSIVAAITVAHGAHLTTEPRPDGGLAVTVTFPPGPSPGHCHHSVPGDYSPFRR